MALILRFLAEIDCFAGQLRHNGWRQTYDVCKILSPSYSLPLLAITNPPCSYVSLRGDWNCETWICATKIQEWKLRVMESAAQNAGMKNCGTNFSGQSKPHLLQLWRNFYVVVHVLSWSAYHGRINHSGAPYQRNAGALFHTRSHDFLWVYTFPQEVFLLVVTFKPTLNVQTFRRQNSVVKI